MEKVLVEDGKQYLKEKDEEEKQKENEVASLTYGKIMVKENFQFKPPNFQQIKPGILRVWLSDDIQ